MGLPYIEYMYNSPAVRDEIMAGVWQDSMNMDNP